MRRTAVAPYVVPGALLLLAAGFTAAAAQYSPASRAVPQLIGGAVAVLCVLDIVSRSATAVGRHIATWLNPAGLAEMAADKPVGAKRGRQSVALGGIVVFTLALVLVGVLPAVALFCLVSLRAGGGLGSRASVLTAAAITLLAWLLFAILLRLALFPGLLFGGEW